VHLSFYIFNTWDFDLLIAQPFRRLLYEGQSGKLNIHLGKKLQFPLSISHYLNSRTKPCPQDDPLEKFRAASLDFLAKLGLEDEARFFIEEEASHYEEEPLDEFAVPPKPLIELKLLPCCHRYYFLGDDLESHIIISDKLTQE
jgi:hypothetical protein